MEEVIKYIYYGSEFGAIVKSNDNELWFNMDLYCIVLKLSSQSCLNLNNDDLPSSIGSLTIESLLNINSCDIESVTILSGKYIPSDEENMHEHCRPSTYITSEICRQINIDFPYAISSSKTGYYCVEESTMCPEVWEYGSVFTIGKDYWDNIELYKHFTQLFEKASMIGVPQFYHTSNRPKDNYEIKVLSSNTKARRLGYLKIILDMFKTYPKISIAHINIKFEEFVGNYRDFLFCYKNNKGEVIRTKTGNSAKPYIELAEQLGLIHKTLGYYTLGKDGRVYNEIRQHLTFNEQNPFLLNDFDVVFFLELLLKEDYLYLYTIITLTHEIDNISYKFLQSNFQTALLEQCRSYIEEVKSHQPFDKIQSIKNRIHRIQNWKKPDVYMEHVLMPRLNWLYDMEFICLNEDLSFYLTQKGRYLCYNLSLWNDINFKKVVSPIWFLDNFFMQMMDTILGLRGNKFTVADYPTIKNYIDNSFLLFKTLAPNRVTFSQMSKFVRNILYFKDNKLIESEDIKNLFGKLDFSEYIYKYQKQYEDGYVQKKQ